MPRGNIKRQHAATLLIRAIWERKRDDCGYDHFHWIAAEGLLDVAQARQIAREVWREEE
jgi:hypothetical protein